METGNHLFYGDNLDVLREQIADESVDLVYLDPPFNSNATYNILFKSPTGTGNDAQIEAFEDTWHWNDSAEDAFDQVARSGRTRAFDLLNAMRAFLGQNDLMAYLAMMAIRLIELHRVLRPTGSLYLHCDPTASHYLKLLLDAIFDGRLRGEIVWKRSSAHSDGKQGARQPGRVHDTILFYSKSDTWTWNTLYTPYEPAYLESEYKRIMSDGRRYKETDLTAAKPGGDVSYAWRVKRPAGGGWIADLDDEHLNPVEGWEYAAVHPYDKRYWAYSKANMQAFARAGNLIHRSTGMPRLVQFADEMPGVSLQDIWADIPPLAPRAQERLGYPTQKPLALLERILAASSNEGDVVLDPFCGCGTAVHAAEKLGRQWIGIDVTHLAISLIEKRLRAAFPAIAFTVEGAPRDLASAEDLAARDKYQFQWWAVSMVDAMPQGGKRKGADGGVDGIIYFRPEGRKTEKALVSVKGGDHVGVQMIRELHSAMEREKAPIGVFVTKALPTRAMEQEAAAVGRFTSPLTGKSCARLQIITLAELFQGRKPDIPLVDPGAAFRRAALEDMTQQGRLL